MAAETTRPLRVTEVSSVVREISVLTHTKAPLFNKALAAGVKRTLPKARKFFGRRLTRDNRIHFEDRGDFTSAL